jgi:hypothetical protein
LVFILSSISVQSRALFPSPSQGGVPTVLLDLVATTITVAELIQQAVAKQIVELQQQQAMKVAEASRAIERHYLTAGAMPTQAKPETIDFPTPPVEQDGQVLGAITTAVKQAWGAFEQRTYIIVIDGKIARSLEEEITCWHDRKVTFLRLVPLIGG